MTDRHAKLVPLLSEEKINYWETNDVANNALSVQNKVSIKFHKEKKNRSCSAELVETSLRDIVTLRVCSFRRIQKRIFDPRFARFRGRKELEIRNWICNLGNLSPTRAICTTASQKMTCFLLFDKLCDYTVQNLVVGSSNSDDGTYKTDKERSALKLKII